MKKTITIILIVIMLFNLISTQSSASSSSEVLNTLTNNNQLNVGSDFLDNLNKGKANVTNDKGRTELVSSLGGSYIGGGVVTILIRALATIPQIAKFTIDAALQGMEGNDKIEFTLYNVIMGNISIFNLDYHIIPTTKLSDLDKEFTNATANEILKITSITYYAFLRDLSFGLSLFILIYIGIRMAISTLATDKVKYKKMLLSWLESVLLLLFMHFIIIILCMVLDKGRDLLVQIAGPNGLNINDIEVTLWDIVIEDLKSRKIFELIVSFIILIMLVYYKLKFFILYMLRFLEVNFLVLIAPLITVTYSIDKVGDNKAQAFSAWFRELIMKASLQLMHGVMYCVFLATMGVIMEYHPLLSIIFFTTLVRAEKIVRNIFSIKDSSIENVKIPFFN